MFNSLEFRRQLLHMLYGPILLALYYFGWLTQDILLGMVIGGAGASYLIKRNRLLIVRRFLSWFERDHHMEKFPGRGILFYTLGAYLTLLLFPQNIAFAGILVLAFGDAVSNVVGRHFGRVKTSLNRHKCLEGTVCGILIAAPAAYLFFPNWIAVFAAATVGMVLELPHIRLGGFEIDDNLIIPMASAFTLSLFV